ncbi:hypothetical protein KUTeg_015264, partial [Tegillarca granosa]
MSQPPAKQRRTQLTISEKKEILTFKYSHPKSTQDEIATHFFQDMRQIAKFKLLNTNDSNVIRQRAGKHEKLEEALYMWFSDVRADDRNAFITDQMLIEKAKVFGQDLNVDNDFSYSSGWLYKFKRRHNISQFIAHGESGSANMTVVTEGRTHLLFYRLQPNSTLATGPVCGQKRVKDRITVALCTDGSDKLKPIEAWNDVNQSTIENCWRHTSILPQDDDTDFDPEDDVPLRDLQCLTRQLPTENLMDVNDYVTANSNIQHMDTLTDNAIVDILLVTLIMNATVIVTIYPTLGSGHLEHLWKAMIDLETFASSKQTKDFFKL